MSEQKTEWFKGTLPGWVATGAILFFCFVSTRYINRAEKKFEQVDQNTISTQLQAARIVALENTNIRLEAGMQNVLKELQAINSTLRRQ